MSTGFPLTPRAAVSALAKAKASAQKGRSTKKSHSQISTQGSKEVLVAVRSLYVDQLKPFGRTLARRLREHALTKLAKERGVPEAEICASELPRIEARQLRQTCERCPALCVEAEGAREYCVTLVGQPCLFLDICSPEDVYVPAFWEAFANYCETLNAEESRLPATKYDCARELVRRRPLFLEGCSLGQVCHVVHLALGQKQLLRQMDSEGRIVAVNSITNAAAVGGLQASSSGATEANKDQLPTASWEQVRSCLWTLLHSKPEDLPFRDGVTFSNVKRLFRVQYQLDLSETALGHPSLFKLLNDPRLRDVCSVHMKENGQVKLSAVTYCVNWGMGMVYMMPVAFMPQDVAAANLPAEEKKVLPWTTSPGQSPMSSTSVASTTSVSPTTGLESLASFLDLSSVRSSSFTESLTSDDAPRSPTNRATAGTVPFSTPLASPGATPRSHARVTAFGMPDYDFLTEACLSDASTCANLEELEDDEQEAEVQHKANATVQEWKLGVKNTFIDVPSLVGSEEKPRSRSMPATTNSGRLDFVSASLSK